ncbi:Stromelysin-1 [Dactylellina cionopaga]|nr:Stromelysin-1 [Dactylellina cionopaga]
MRRNICACGSRNHLYRRQSGNSWPDAFAFRWQLTGTIQGFDQATMESAISTALEKWARISNFTFTMDPSNPNVFMQVVGPGETDAMFEDGFTMGYAPIGPNYQETAYVKLNNIAGGAGDSSRWSTVAISNLCLHEWGHVLGLNHSDDSSAIMAPSIQNMHSDRELTETDVSAFGSIYTLYEHQPAQNSSNDQNQVQSSQSQSQYTQSQYRYVLKRYLPPQYPQNRYPSGQYISTRRLQNRDARGRPPTNAGASMNRGLPTGGHWKRYTG